jgi:hypothetical protein
MKTDHQNEPVFLQTVSVAIAQLKQRLKLDYEQAYQDLHEIIHLVLAMLFFVPVVFSVIRHKMRPREIEDDVDLAVTQLEPATQH